MKVINGLKYSKDHEWVKVEGNRAIIGITDYAQDSLGDIVFIDLPEVGRTVRAGDAVAVVESVKAASDVYSPVSGTVIEVNTSLEASPELINQDPYENWILVLEMSDPGELGSLMDAEGYERFCEEEA
ncbi:MAG: glycine cleavage system protein GcvH [Caldicoprobacter oshimai]|uniref:Glycine cleavage system H protein n=1 Tax=Caldicoprobacter faecalis TaxID=937334 RepID=A0A1I5UR58_9FIRM|nr:glycine cleavage system protein GcvH [Caldicoprobacter faecalis]PZN10050.1 MAG: glycine cleavage system protein GcvH [Caldicoprobacter oshimai]SFP97763.1 glycine cleavage system H protein [Caldicoprobacter faecalis]